MDCTYDNFTFHIIVLFQYYLCANYFVIIKEFSGFLRHNVFFFEDNCTFSIMLVLIILYYIVNLIFRGNDEGVWGGNRLFTFIYARFNINVHVGIKFLRESIVFLKFV